MADTKTKGFMMYYSWGDVIFNLSDEDLAELIRVLYMYGYKGIKPEKENPVIQNLFLTYRQQIDRDAKKYAERIERQSEGGIKGAEIKKAKNKALNDDTE